MPIVLLNMFTSFQQFTNAFPRAVNLALVSFPAMMRTVFVLRILSFMLFSLMVYIYFAIHLSINVGAFLLMDYCQEEFSTDNYLFR